MLIVAVDAVAVRSSGTAAGVATGVLSGETEDNGREW
jgi:hypothetical protein